MTRVTDSDRVLAVLRDRPRDVRAIVVALGRPATGENLRNIRVVANRLLRQGKVIRVYNGKVGAYVWHLP